MAAVNSYYTSPEFREIERLREKARHDKAQALYHAEQEGIQKGIQQGVAEGRLEIARNALRMKMPIDDIVRLTGLTREEIEMLLT